MIKISDSLTFGFLSRGSFSQISNRGGEIYKAREVKSEVDPNLDEWWCAMKMGYYLYMTSTNGNRKNRSHRKKRMKNKNNCELKYGRAPSELNRVKQWHWKGSTRPRPLAESIHAPVHASFNMMTTDNDLLVGEWHCYRHYCYILVLDVSLRWIVIMKNNYENNREKRLVGTPMFSLFSCDWRRIFISILPAKFRFWWLTVSYAIDFRRAHPKYERTCI